MTSYILYIYLLLTAIGLQPGGSVYKDEAHEKPQYNTINIHKYNTSKYRKYRKNTENT
jgi:hypothetical protein